MTSKHLSKPAGAIAAFAAIVLGMMLSNSRPVRAGDEDDNDRNESKVRKGFQIAPVPLNLKGKDHELVGLGSYIVNAQSDCNGCHSAGPQTEFLPGANPYFLHQTEKINPATYLGGGRNFGKVSGPPSPDIISRNLTPDSTGRPEGGHTFAEFLQILRTGKDFDHLHPNCSATITTNCFPLGPMVPPVNGDLLQVMPWPIYKNMTERDLRAIYEYLSTVPCIAGPPSPSPLHNDCN
jgi:hypothetical protein